MTAATIAYALAGVLLIIGLTGYLIADALAWAGYGGLRWEGWRTRWIVATAVLVVAWLAAALLR